MYCRFQARQSKYQMVESKARQSKRERALCEYVAEATDEGGRVLQRMIIEFVYYVESDIVSNGRNAMPWSPLIPIYYTKLVVFVQGSLVRCWSSFLPYTYITNYNLLFFSFIHFFKTIIVLSGIVSL